MLIFLMAWLLYVISFLICRYVKEKRITISPNFNFLGQLLEYEQQMEKEGSCQFSGSKRRCIGKCDVIHLLSQCFYVHTVKAIVVSPWLYLMSHIIPLSSLSINTNHDLICLSWVTVVYLWSINLLIMSRFPTTIIASWSFHVGNFIVIQGSWI